MMDALSTSKSFGADLHWNFEEEKNYCAWQQKNI